MKNDLKGDLQGCPEERSIVPTTGKETGFSAKGGAGKQCPVAQPSGLKNAYWIREGEVLDDLPKNNIIQVFCGSRS